ncbi:MAG: MgtC/SapB family protein, partial [Cyanobacteriota bacterium]|nr:MgtC/SapB family protein [Cyanobacteriota bacterium]
MVLSALPPTYAVFIRADDWLGLSFRLTMALLVGGAIGWNRQATGKSAGLRTHMLVSLGAALFVLLPLLSSTST